MFDNQLCLSVPDPFPGGAADFLRFGWIILARLKKSGSLVGPANRSFSPRSRKGC